MASLNEHTDQGKEARAGRTGTSGEGLRFSLGGRALAVARAVWLAVCALAVTLFAAGLPGLYEDFRTLSVYGAGVRGTVRANLAQLGLSADLYAAYLLALGAMLAVACFTVAAVIFLRRSGEPMALFVALMLVLLGATFSGSAEGIRNPLWEWSNNLVQALSLLSVLLFFYLFPDGRFAPRWSSWLAVLCIVFVAPLYLLPFAPDDWEFLPYVLLVSGLFLAGVAAQVYRYLRVSTPAQRQQTKWVVFGFAAALGGYIAVILLPTVFAGLEPGTLADLAAAAATVGLMLLIPLSLGFSILRYRLWDIDIVINRTLVYGTLSVLLALIYSGGVFGLQFAFRAVSGQESQAAVVVSTLAVAALFVPLKRRTQATIDRRFYRSKYDAAKTLRRFADTLREEVEPEALQRNLVSAVEQTVQPAHVSLWLRPEILLPESGRDGGERGISTTR